MWITRILQVFSLFLAAYTVLIAIFIAIKFPSQLAADQSIVAPSAFHFMGLVAPAALLYLLIGTGSTLFLASKKRRAAYGFDAAPWRPILWINICALIALFWSPIVMILTFTFVGYLTT